MVNSDNGEAVGEYLKRLVRKRDTLSRRIGRIANNLDNVKAVDNTDSSIDAARIDCDDLEKCFAAFESLQAEIENELEEDQLVNHEAEGIRIETLVRRARVSATNFIRRSVTPLENSNQNIVTVATTSSTKIKRPEITVPKFSGDVKRWSEFRNVFESLVIDEKLYSDVEKMIYLKQAVEGKASDLIANFEISKENFAKAWEKLRRRYENRKAVISTHLDALCKLPNAKSENDVAPLLDAATDAIESLHAVGVENGWELMLCYLVSSKLDTETRKQWELLIVKEEEYPTYAKLEKFLQERVRVFESIGGTVGFNRPNQVGSCKKEKPIELKKALFTSANSYDDSKNSGAQGLTQNTKICFDCGVASHSIQDCKVFHGRPIAEKTQIVQKRGLCYNCLNRGHRVATCRFKRCEKCSKRHHILLHSDGSKPPVETKKPVVEPVKKDTASNEEAKVLLTTADTTERVCLPVALVYVFGKNGHRYVARAFLDSCGGINAISEKLAKKLQCKTRSSNVSLSALVPGELKIAHSCDLVLNSRCTEYKLKGRFEVLPVISDNFSGFEPSIVTNSVLQNYQLADNPKVNAGRVELLIGAEFYAEIMLNGKIQIGERMYLQESTFGWVFIGVTKTPELFATSNHCFLTLEASFQKFWTLDEIEEETLVWTPEERRVDEKFEKTFARDSFGRFVVSLPKCTELKMLGESRNIAFRRLLSLERRLSKSEEIFNNYNEFLVEYEKLNHMQCIDSSQALIYLPHHAVFRDASKTTRIRVVFDAACLTSSGYSLNDVLAKGPVLQDELFVILMRFRCHKIVFTADIEKMYRQVLVDPVDRKLQCILWRDNVKTIRTFQLNTLTYGTKPASYLATKCLSKLADLFADEYPESAEIVRSDFYMDDLLSGADSLEEAKIRIEEIVKILDSGCFPLRKFASNCKELLLNLEPSRVAQSHMFEDEEDITVLGVKWNSVEDRFIFFSKLSVESDRKVVTKRLFLSKIFRIFDPLGLLAPIVIALKFLLQELWRCKIEWDDPVPKDILDKFNSICRNLDSIPSFSVPRWVEFSVAAEIHVFCDASQKGYGAAVYIRSMGEQSGFKVHLLSAKSRVAPVKVVSLPRLELCAALLGANLFVKVRKALKLSKSHPVYAWSDSTIVLSWLYSENRTWNTFVANRVSKIRSIIDPSRWFHVKSDYNAADIISRGIESNFAQLEKFWHGPVFLREVTEILPCAEFDSAALVECKDKQATTLVTSVLVDYLDQFSSYSRVISFVAYFMRFSKGLRGENYESSVLSAVERSRAHTILIKRSQATIGSKVKKLDCFVDDLGLLRLRSRLGKSDLTFESKYPIILPKDRFLVLLLEYFHLRFFHAGRSFLKNFVRSTYHVLGDLNRLIRGIVHRCVRCRRFASNLQYSPPVGELPPCRVTVSQAFVEVGVDFAGPFQTRAVGPGRNRGKVLFKSYVAVFVCMASRATHFEVVEDLSTKAFLDSFVRFTSRRGLCQVVYSDHGTNFVGADRELRCAFEFLKKNRSEIVEYCSKLGISWKFIPERAPHFGGLWEAAVKSFKFHFVRIVGTQILSFSELSTLVCQIEAVLNARPICSSTDNSSTILTPAHLSIGRSVAALPQITGAVVKGAARVRYSLVRSIFDRFWAIWRQEYLIAIRKGYFRKVGARSAQVNDVVLLQDSNVPPIEWPMGRIVKCILGTDGVCRVVDVLVNGRVLRRPVVKLVPLLPLE